MIALKCGKCGMTFELNEENVANHSAFGTCPNCQEQIPNSIGNGVYHYAMSAVQQKTDWKVYIAPTLEELKKSQL